MHLPDRSLVLEAYDQTIALVQFSSLFLARRRALIHCPCTLTSLYNGIWRNMVLRLAYKYMVLRACSLYPPKNKVPVRTALRSTKDFVTACSVQETNRDMSFPRGMLANDSTGTGGGGCHAQSLVVQKYTLGVSKRLYHQREDEYIPFDTSHRTHGNIFIPKFPPCEIHDVPL